MHSVVQHYKPQTFDIANEKTLFDYIKQVLKEEQILLTNLISNLCDSTNYMHGKKSWFETLFQDHIPHLLDTDCDTCHHMHVTRKFLLPFGKHIEYFCNDFHNDSKWSPDLRDYLSDICSYLGIKYQIPSDCINHYWLSTFDPIKVNLTLPALTIFYDAWLEKDNKVIYKDIYNRPTEVNPLTFEFLSCYDN